MFCRIKKSLINRWKKSNTFLWYANSTNITGKLLAEQLGIDCGLHLKPKRYSNVICWGTSAIPSDKQSRYKNIKCEEGNVQNIKLNNVNFCNDFNAVQRNRNKYVSLKIMNNGGVRVPKFCKAFQVQRWVKDGDLKLPLIARTTRHQGGEGLKICLCDKDIRQALEEEYSYFMEYVPNDREYRVHIFKDEVLRISRKVPTGEIESEWIKNKKKGWGFKDGIKKENVLKYDNTMLEECKRAVKSLGLDFGGVDVIYADDKKSYVIEVNTAPSLNEKGQEIYLNKFRKEFGL